MENRATVSAVEIKDSNALEVYFLDEQFSYESIYSLRSSGAFRAVSNLVALSIRRSVAPKTVQHVVYHAGDVSVDIGVGERVSLDKNPVTADFQYEKFTSRTAPGSDP